MSTAFQVEQRKKREQDERANAKHAKVGVITAPNPRAYDLDTRRELDPPYEDPLPETPRTMIRNIREHQDLQETRLKQQLAERTLSPSKRPDPTLLPPPPTQPRDSIMINMRKLTAPPPPPPVLTTPLSPGRASAPGTTPGRKDSSRDAITRLQEDTPRAVAKSVGVSVGSLPIPDSEPVQGCMTLQELEGPQRATACFSPRIQAILKQQVDVWGETPANSCPCKTVEDLQDEGELRAIRGDSSSSTERESTIDPLDAAMRVFLEVPKDLPRDGKTDLVAVFFGEAEPGSRPASTSSSNHTPSSKEHLSWEETLRQGASSSTSSLENSRERVVRPPSEHRVSPPEIEKPRRPSGVLSDGDEDNATLRQQLISIMRMTGDKLCRRGICCYKTESACGGRPGRQPLDQLLTSSSKTGTIVRQRGGGSTVGSVQYVHRADPLDPEQESCQMEYAAAVCFLIACERTIDQGRRSDDILHKLDLFVDTNQDEHALRASRTESKHRFELGSYLTRSGVPKLRVSNGALIAAALYLGLAKIEELDLYPGPWLPIYIYDATATLTSLPSSESLSVPGKSVLNTLKVETRQEKRTSGVSSSAGSSISRLFGSSKGVSAGKE